MPSPPPAPRPAYRQPVPFPPGYKPVRPASAREILQDNITDSQDLEKITAEDFQAMRVPIEEDQHDPEASADTVCKCGACLWYSLFYVEFLVDWFVCPVSKSALRFGRKVHSALNIANLAIDRYVAVPGQVPPHPMHVGDNKLIKASIDL